MIGLIFGDTDFPKEILKKIKRKKFKYLIVDLSKNNFFKKDKNSNRIPIGQFGKIINLLKENKCKKVLFAGKVNKPKFSKLRLDFKGFYYMPRIIKSSKLGDAAILNEIINIFKKEKIKTINSLFYNPELSLKKGNYTKVKPNKFDKADINKAILILSKLNKYNYSQGAVVRNKKLIAIEGNGGTQKLLKKSKNKKIQDLRIDLPTVGLKTFKQCKSAGLKGIVLKSNQNVFLERRKCINFANKNKMYILIR